MMNYIGMYGANLMIRGSVIFDSTKSQTKSVAATAVIPKGGLDKIFFNLTGKYVDVSSVNAGILIAIALAVVMYVLLNKTTFGYELRACGFNKDAARYAGISEKRAIVLSMVLAGALSGTAGALMYLAPASGMHIHVAEVLSPRASTASLWRCWAFQTRLASSSRAVRRLHLGGRTYLQSLKYMQEVIDINHRDGHLLQRVLASGSDLISRAGARRARRGDSGEGAHNGYDFTFSSADDVLLDPTSDRGAGACSPSAAAWSTSPSRASW